MILLHVFCAVALLTSAVFLICTLPFSDGQNMTSAVPSNVTDYVTTGVPTTTVSFTSHYEVYLKRTESGVSPLNLSVVVDVRSSFELSFRTCSHGSLLSQFGDDKRNYFQLILDENGSLTVSLSSGSASSSVLLGTDLNDNQYYTFVWTYRHPGSVAVSVKRGATVLNETMLLGPSFDRDLFNMNLRNGSKLLVGDGLFEGCLRDGVQGWFTLAAEADDNAVQWDSCPRPTVCNRTDTTDGCVSSSCVNNARFVQHQMLYFALKRKTYYWCF